MRQIKENHPQIQKIKKTILTILVMGLFFCLGGRAFANNILLNPGFENGLNDWVLTYLGWEAQSIAVYQGSLAAKDMISNINKNIFYFGSVLL